MSLYHYPLQNPAILIGSDVLRDILQDDVAAGVVDYGSFRVAQRGAGANMSCDVGVGGSGKAVAYVPYSFSGTNYGLRRVSMTALL
jgi:hypothetical protein